MMPRTTPLTRRLARDLGVDLERVRGTGRGGRITRADVQAAAAARGPAAHPPVDAGSATLPLVHLVVAVDAEALLELRGDLGREMTVPDLVTRACAMLLRSDPTLDRSFGGDALTVAHLNVDQLRPP